MGASEIATGRRAGLALALVLAGAALARVAFGRGKSLVLDEFHTWFHATRPSAEAFFETLLLDNHPPLGFLTVAGARALLGSSELALRAPAILFGMLELALVARFATRRLGGARGAAATALLAASSLHLDFSTQARMYALHSLAATVTLVSLHAVLTRETARGARIALAVALATAFHTHYFGGQYALGYGLAALAAGALDAGARRRLPRLVAPVAAAALASLPWALLGFRRQLAHELPPGGDDLAPADLAEAFVHLVYLNVRLGGETLRIAFIAAGAVVTLLALRGALALGRERSERALALLLAAGAFGVPLLAFALAHLAPRLGFTWHYLLPSAAPLAMLAAAGARGAARFAFAAALTLAVWLAILNVRSPGTEDFRGAVGHALAAHEERATARSAIVSVEWQPALFPQGQPYDYYAPRLVPRPPARLAMEGYGLADPSDLDGLASVVLIVKSLPRDQPLVRMLERDFAAVARRSFGFALEVVVYERRSG